MEDSIFNSKYKRLNFQINELRSILNQSLIYISSYSVPEIQQSVNLQKWQRLVNKKKQSEIKRNQAAYTIQSFWKCSTFLNGIPNTKELVFSDYKDFEKLELKALHEIADELTEKCLLEALGNSNIVE